MDSWKYLSEGRGICLSEELDFPFDGHGCKSKLMGCELKPFPNVESYPLVSNTQALERWDLMDLGLSDEIRKSYSISSEPSGEVFSDEIGNDYGNVASSFGEEKDSGLRILTDFRQSNRQDYSLVDLKLGRLADGGVARDGDFAEAGVSEPSTESSPSEKRARSTTLYSRSSTCQVLGCNKDLSSYKGYYKRHKVCDVHTRTAKVVVQGIEQRFCQQCSRFHQLIEFDDRKRSCRRRLAAHNNRRRKPRFTSDSGCGIIDFSSSQTFPGVVSNVTVSPGGYEEYKWVENIKYEDSIKGSDFFLHINGVGDRMNNVPGDVKGNIIGTATPTVQNLSSIHQTSCALSLLSAQSQNVSSQLLGTTILSTLINKGGHADSNNFGDALNNSACIYKEMTQSGLHAPGMFPTEADGVESTMIKHSDGNTVDLHPPGVGSSMEPDLRNTTLGRGIILDLLQLSSHLKRVEQQRHSTESEAE